MAKLNQYENTTSTLLLNFIRAESFGGLLLIFASVAALLLANSPLSQQYDAFINWPFEIQINQWGLSKPLLLWINDGLMAVFFLYIGLEIKREILEGQLSKISQILLPGVAALGGILFPALIYALFNHGNSETMKGWAIPTATDIAFALGVLALLGKRIPASLKLFLMAIAIFDDFVAILIIAIFYTTQLSLISLSLASCAIIALVIFNRWNVSKISVYCFIGLLLWFFVLKSGVHATLAGVVLAFTIPLNSPDQQTSLLKDLEKALHGWVSYFILPLFAFANAGIHFDNIIFNDFLSPLTLGITLGLFFGKQLGIFIPSFLLIKMQMATLPDNTNWRHIYGTSLLCGIGFTMSLFISTLAFENEMYIVNSRLGIFIGTLSSAFLGFLILRSCQPSQSE
jgi:NhaA family Na+:H+ antiporter